VNPLRYLPFLRRGFLKEGPPLHLTLFVTGVCNLRCRHCFHWKEVAASSQGPSLEQVQKLAGSCADLGPLLWVSFGGGEPFLRKDLPQLAQAFGKHGLRHLAIPTNGLVEGSQQDMTEEILRLCPETFLSLAVSIDGPPQIHDSIRGLEGSHARAIQSMANYQVQARESKNLGVGLIVTLTAENQDSLADHVEELVREYRPDNVTINLARGTALDETLLDVNLDRYRELTDLKKRLMEDGLLKYFDFPLAKLAVARDRQMYRYVEAVARGEGDYLPCTAGRLSAVIFEDGAMHPCEMLGKSMGNLNDVDWDIGKLWGATAASQMREEILSTRCRCTWECAQADNVLFNPSKWVPLALDSL
jgi:MoaA/NifB/PqqE/SkfB family radical SAM enzyme